MKKNALLIGLMAMFMAVGSANAQEEQYVTKDDTCSSGYIFDISFCMDLDTIFKISTPPTIDGNAADWSDIAVTYTLDVPYGATNKPANEADLTVNVKAAWDTDNFYILFDVTDDKFFADPAAGEWRRDGIEFGTYMVGDYRKDASGSGNPGFMNKGEAYGASAPAHWQRLTLVHGFLDKVFDYGFNIYEHIKVDETTYTYANTNAPYRDLTGLNLASALKTGGYIIEGSFSWDYLNGYTNDTLKFDDGTPTDGKMVPEDGAMFTYYFNVNDVDSVVFTGDNRQMVSTPNAAWQWPDPAMNMFVLATPKVVSTSTIGSASKSIELYPVPAKDLLNIRSQSTIYSVEIINAVGQSVRTFNYTGGSLDVSGLNRGVYMLKATMANGRTEFAKFMKE
jgi:hypothetical protein